MDMSRLESSVGGQVDCQLQLPFREILAQIRDATVAVAHAGQQLQATSDRHSLLRQVAQSTAVLPVLLTNQSRMIEGLEKQFNDQFTLQCGAEIQEIARIARLVQSAVERLKSNESMDIEEQCRLAQCVFESTSRLNILQQRIAGKMMKVKQNG